MNADRLRDAGVDYDKGVERFLGIVHSYERALVKFSRDDTFSRICAAYDAHDMERMFTAAHEFKGMCGNIALDSLYEASGVLLELLRAGEHSETELAAAYYRLSKEYRTIHEAVLAAKEA